MKKETILILGVLLTTFSLTLFITAHLLYAGIAFLNLKTLIFNILGINVGCFIVDFILFTAIILLICVLILWLKFLIIEIKND